MELSLADTRVREVESYRETQPDAVWLVCRWGGEREVWRSVTGNQIATHSMIEQQLPRLLTEWQFVL